VVSKHVPAAIYPREIPGTNCTGGWVGPGACLTRRGKSRHPTGNRSPDRPARSLQTLPKVLFKINPKFRSSKGARIPDHWSLGTINYFAMEPNYSDCHVYTQHRRFTCTEKNEAHSCPVHRLLQNFGSSVRKLNVTVLETRIWRGLLDFWKIWALLSELLL
jgi:hypothetical protein